MLTNHIIETKLKPPMIKEHYIRRASVMKNLQKMTEYPLTLLHSGAGFGKSTALSLYMYDYHPNYCWYSITSGDDDLVPFIRYIIYAIRTRYPSFGASLLNDLENMKKYFRDEEIGLLNSLFINELTSIREKTILVIDDYHLVDHSFAINRWLENLIENLPANIHLVLSSRMKPRWQNLLKWKVTGKLLEIDEKQLALSLEDVEVLFTDYYGVNLAGKQLKQIHELTEGWIIAISLIGEQLQRGASLQNILKLHHSSINDLFEYLAMEVFSTQTPLVQSFIEQVAVLEEITPALCDQILGIQGSEGILERLLSQNAFIYKLDGTNEYRFHALFKTAIERKVKEEKSDFYRALNQRIAEVYVNNGQIERAIFHYQKAEDDEAVAHLLSHYAEQILLDGKLESLMDSLKCLPDAIKDRFPSLWFYEGEVLRYMAYYEKAKQCYEHLIDLCQESGDVHLLAKAYEGIAKIFLDTIQPYRAENYLRLAIETTEKRLGQSHPDTKRLYIFMAENLINLGQAKLAEKWIQKGKLTESQLMMNNLDARLCLRTGKLHKSRKILEKRLEEDNSLPQTHRETAVLLSYINACLGLAEEAKALAQKGIEHGLKYKNSFLEACGWMRLGNAHQLLATYADNITEQCYVTALEIMERIDVPRGKAEPYMGLSLLYSKMGKYEQAKEYAQLALYETEKVHDTWLSTYIRLGLAIVHYFHGADDEALKIFSYCEKKFKEIGDPYGYTVCCLWQAHLFYREGNWQRFQEAMTIFLQELQIGDYEFLLTKKTLFGPRDLQSCLPLLLKAKEMAIHLSYLHRLLERLGYDNLDSHPGYTVKVTTFGTFTVFLGSRPVTDKEWQRIKAKELFQFLLVYREQWWTREEIYEQLWPDVPEKSAEQEFKVIMNALNKTLEPKRKARSTPFFIMREGNKYRINPQAAIEIDYIDFEQWIHQGLQEKDVEKAKSLLLRGIHLYKGDFLPELANHLHISAKRDQYRQLFLRGAERLAQIHVQQSRFDVAIRWCERILEIDRTWEESYRLLMYCYYQKNNRPLALKYYHLCSSILKEELGVEPMDATKQMYDMIMEADKLEL